MTEDPFKETLAAAGAVGGGAGAGAALAIAAPYTALGVVGPGIGWGTAVAGPLGAAVGAVGGLAAYGGYRLIRTLRHNQQEWLRAERAAAEDQQQQ